MNDLRHHSKSSQDATNGFVIDDLINILFATDLQKISCSVLARLRR
jgi:hypothetical protein